jgi:putative transport protein
MIDLLADNPVLLVFVVLGLGAALGAVKVRGVSLGPAGALFAGLALSAIDDRLAIPEIVGPLGLALFTYTIGLASGPAFFASIRSQGRTIVSVAVVLVAAALGARGLANVFDLGAGVGAGLFAGSLTNTPALAAAVEALNGSSEPVVGYSVAYPIGVVGMILAAAWALRSGRPRVADDDVRPADLATVTIEVRAGVRTDLTALAERFGGRAVFARIERDGTQFVPNADAEVLAGDLLSVAAHDAVVPELAEVLGTVRPVQLSHDRSHLDMRRIVVSDRRLTGRRLGDLDLYDRFGAVATRLRRGDIDLLATDDVTVLPGDRLRIVAPRSQMHAIASYLGDSERRVAEIDALGFMCGIAAGLALGLVKVPLFGTGHFALGVAGGPLVVGLALGRAERTGPVVWQPPYGANLALRQFGTILFLGTVGSRSGGALSDALSSSRGATVALSALVLVTVTAAVTLVVGRRLLHLGGARLAGVLAGVETQPAVLAFAGEQTTDDRVSTSYALVFPVAMLVKILLAQLLVLL